jgi:hypothetical protein
MSLKILFDPIREEAVFVDSSTERAFGPTFDDTEHAERAIVFCQKFYKADPRKLSHDDLVDVKIATSTARVPKEIVIDNYGGDKLVARRYDDCEYEVRLYNRTHGHWIPLFDATWEPGVGLKHFEDELQEDHEHPLEALNAKLKTIQGG